MASPPDDRATEAGTLPDEVRRASEKFEQRQEGIARAEGFGATEGAQAITRRYIVPLADALKLVLSKRGKPVHQELLAVIRDLEPDVLVLCILQGAQDSIGQRKNLRDTALHIGGLIADECWAKGLTNADPDLARRIERRTKRLAIPSEHQKKYALTLAGRAGYKTDRWDTERLTRAGEWALLILLEHLPGVFTWEDAPREDDNEGEDKFLTYTDEASAYIEAFVEQVILSKPDWAPQPEPPRPWTAWDKGGTWDKRLARSLTVVREYQKQTKEAVQQAIHDGTMKPALDGLNALQSVAWTINSRVLRVMRACASESIEMEGLPSAEALPAQKLDVDKFEQRELRRAKLRFISERALFSKDIHTAKLLAERERFWLPMNMDWRGRVYGVPHFNLQREERVRALFLFADGEPIGEEGLYWLKVHLANCGDDNKISKQPFSERVAWVDSNLSMINSIIANPLSDLVWTKADKPFMFLAACFELMASIDHGPTYVTRLPIFFDGSCNGLQHLCAMTRATEGALVNLTPHQRPQDIYQTVADRVKRQIENDLLDQGKRQQAKTSLDWIWKEGELARPRKTFKRSVMTYPYSSKTEGMAEQIREDTMEPLSTLMRRGKLKEHPFGSDNGYKASWYLAACSYRAIGQQVRDPAKAMTFLQKLTRALAKEGKPLRWKSPAGLPWINGYYEERTKRVHLWLYKRGVRVPHMAKLAIGSLPKVDDKGAARGVAPNFVHALDASHLFLTVNAAVNDGIKQIATVHDSFGCLPSRAARFRKIIREQFVRMYQEHNVLQEVYEQAWTDFSGDPKALPKPPDPGSLDIEEMRGAEYAFA